jgi:hypothetical protein
MRLAFLLSLLAVISANTVAQEPLAAAAPAAFLSAIPPALW